jgi:two-component system, OmpR family, heavy metal sensor histidine kinase CusS
MSPAPGLLRRGLGRLRRSMTAQISLSITLVSVLIIAVFLSLTGQFVRGELREENELTLLANLAFIRDDLAASGYDLAQAQHLVDRAESRVHRLHAAVLDGEGRRVIAASAHYDVPLPAALPRPVLDAGLLPTQARVTEIEGLREALAAMTSTWRSPDDAGHRLLAGRIQVPAQAGRPARSVIVDLAIETTNTSEVRRRDRRNVLIGLAVAALLASALGVWIARHIVVSARRLGAAASRIGAQALDERLPLDDTPVELVESTLAFNRMLDRLQNAFERLSAFSSDLAHDLRTPVGNLLGEAQVALSRPRSADEYRAVLESAVEEYERLSRMIGNMLFLAQVDNDRAAMSIGRIELDTALDRVIGYFELIAEERGVRLLKTPHSPAEGARHVWADETMLIRAVSNLVSNALRHAPAGTSVELTARLADDAGCTIEVANEGPAIAPEQQARIFERFYRADTSRHGSAAGSGLGLAIVRSIMELHGGRAEVRSAPGERTVFRLHFPAPPSSPGA